MKFKFESNLDFQLDAINAVVDLFRGQSKKDHSSSFVFENGVIPNFFDLREKQVLDNLKAVQGRNNLKISEKLDGWDFSVEMETGTGKTYVYLRTILDLNQRYGFHKFIIIVPSVAIREGVLKSLEITKEHFRQLYDNLPYNFYEYDSSKLSRIRQFARNNNVEIMVMTLDSFNKDSNVMNQSIDKLSGQKPIDLVREVKPILILDEPQNMESDKAKEALSKLNPIFKLRYSATHRQYYNLIYRLTPVDAYNKNLVKRIEVLSVVKENDYNGVYVKCKEVIADTKGIKAVLEVNKKQKKGHKIETITVNKDDDLYKKTKSSEYQNLFVTKIDARYGIVEFSNGLSINKGQEVGGDRKELMKVQIQETIEEHFRKLQKLKPHGIKVLSLFFIDRVANYKDSDGFIRKTFIEEFEKVKKKLKLDFDVDKVHNGYFSNYKSDEGMENDKDAFDLIMKDKEKLLSFDEPTQFIFSHSALREGWDNPNVFNICTLNETVSEMKKRQEIGRGVRIPVNQDGERIKDLEFNILTVVANQSYSEYVSRLQQEYVDEYGLGGAPPLPPNARTRKTIKLKKGFKLTPEFKELWKRVSKRTKYAVSIDTNKLRSSCIEKIDRISVKTVKIKSEKAEIKVDENGIKTALLGEESREMNKDYEIPNIVEAISDETKLTKSTVLDILSEIKNFKGIFNNPKEFTGFCTEIIKEEMKDFLVNGIQYIELNDLWKMELFDEYIESYEEYIVPVNNSIYDGVIWNSDGEKTFAQKLDSDNRIKLFIKLPSWFTVNTPIGEYNPDWAIVREEKDLAGNVKDRLYLVRETKFVQSLENDLTSTEKRKIKCAEQHFTTIKVDFKTIKNYDEMT